MSETPHAPPDVGPEPPRDVIDVDALMADLRRRVEEKKARGLYTVDALAIDATETLEPYRIEDLERLRELAVQRVDLTLSASSKPVIGGLVTRFKRLLVRGASQPMYSMAAQTSQYNASLLGYVSQLAREITFLQRQVESAQRETGEVRHSLSEADLERQRDMGHLAGRVEELSDAIRGQAARLATAEAAVGGLAASALPERVRRLENEEPGLAQPREVAPQRSATGGSLARLRLTAAESRDPNAHDRWSRYAETLGSAGAILHVGAGIGTALALLPEGAEGVEADAELAAAAVREGRQVHQADPLSFVSSLEAGSLRGVLITDLVERTDGRTLLALAGSITRALAPGGRLIVEGLNPAALWTLAEEVWRDTERLRPVHPEALGVTLEAAGLRVERVDFSDPPTEKELPLPPPGTPADESIRASIEQLNALLFGARRYAVHAIR